MIKNYNQFINESIQSIGEQIELLAKDNEYALNIISQYTQDIDPTIRLANAINLLDKHTQEFILKMILDNKNGNEVQKEPSVSAYTVSDLSESQQTIGGKNLFKCFLKVITSLGQKNIQVDFKNVPESFIIIFKTNSLNIQNIKSIMSRYQYFDSFINKIDYSQNESQLYYGITSNLTFQYGILNEEQILPFGEFKLNKGIYNYLLTLDSPSAVSLKKYLINLDINKLILISKIKNEMNNFIPGESQHKTSPMIDGDVITFGYYGIGKWNNGKMDDSEVESIKQKFRTFLMTFKWSDKVKISVTSNDFWIYLNFKLK